MKILIIAGTRPECIKIAPVVAALRKHPEICVRIVSTGQHREMLKSTFDIFGIAPDFDLDVMTHDQSLSELAASVLGKLDPLLVSERPSLILAQGDTTSAMATAIASFHQGIPFGHIEAGLRTHKLDDPFPEEMNRVLVARVAKLHFAPTETARANLLAEGVKSADIYVTGNTVIDALLDVAKRDIPCSYPKVSGRKLVLITAHRRESFGAPLQRICSALRDIHDRLSDAEFVFPVHPNPKVRDVVMASLSNLERLHLIEPVDYQTIVSLMKNAYIVVTDSGGLQEEAPALGKPVFVLRENTERPEAVEAGVVRLVGTQADNISAEIVRVFNDQTAYKAMARGISPYGDGHAATRIAENCVRFLADRLSS
jgi:UDP-N-acetylglucosamine 2-epimerase (non-hydrolysing)